MKPPYIFEYIAMLVVACILITAGCLTLDFFIKRYSANMGVKETTIVQTTEFSEDWKEISLNKVEISNKEYNSIRIYSALPAKQNGFIAPNGKLIIPDLMLEDEQGNRCSSKFMSRKALESLRFEWSETDSNFEKCFSKSNNYKKLWIRSSERFNATKITWEAYNVKDLK